MKKYLKPAALVVALAVALLVFSRIDTTALEAGLQERVAALGAAAPVAFVLIYAVLAAVLVPITPATLVGGIVFGKGLGFLLNMAGALLGASITFFGARHLGRDTLARFVRPGLVARMDAATERHGLTMAAYIRLAQVPFGLANVAAGVSRMRFLDFLLGTCIGIVPGIFVFTYLPRTIAELRRPSDILDRQFLLPALLILGALAVPLVVQRIRHRNAPEETPPPP